MGKEKGIVGEWGRVGRRWGVRVSPGGWIREEGVAGWASWAGHCGLLGRLVQLGQEVGVYPFDFFVFLLSFNFFSVYFIFQIVLVL